MTIARWVGWLFNAKKISARVIYVGYIRQQCLAHILKRREVTRGVLWVRKVAFTFGRRECYPAGGGGFLANVVIIGIMHRYKPRNTSLG